MLYSPTKTQKLLGNPDKSANPTASSPACAGLAGEHCSSFSRRRRLANRLAAIHHLCIESLPMQIINLISGKRTFLNSVGNYLLDEHSKN